MPRKHRNRVPIAPDKYRPYNDDNPIIDTTPPTPPPSIKPSARQRAALLQRLTAELMVDQGGECFWCGIMMWHPRVKDASPSRLYDDRATFDHKITRKEGGIDTLENGVAACRYCNHHRADTPFEIYLKWPPS